ncbi:MAG: tRNA 2-thiouridine(34) synthase MnmA [Candidatus Shikimatogenerans sp. Tduv]|uniref:tRNA-uridine 2-sulfurtransferase n=1 Tax=Candidatus Shikimatogenerans sp. Tduv TaxID=3158567 RepID=A0AAU7QR47_9FLAO
MKKKVIILLSGGVDSSISLYLIKNKYIIIGAIFIKINNKCNNEDENIARLIANRFKIPFYLINLKKEYNNYVMKYFINNYYKGYTPNPDIICNYKIKFNSLLKKIKILKYNYIITGHYAIIKKKIYNNERIYNLYESIDKEKDQSYFLSRLNAKQLKLLKFPLGKYTKKKIRFLAKKYNFINYNKKSTKGICFIGKLPIKNILKFNKKGVIFLLKNFKINSIYIKNIYKYNFHNIKYNFYNYKIIGNHKGCIGYTRGQRKGLKLGGYKKPLYIIDLNVKKNIIYMGENINHYMLYNNSVFIKKYDIHFIDKFFKKKIKKKKKIKILSRYRDKQILQKTYLYKNYKGYIFIFKKKQFCIAKGQFLVFQKKNKILGNGIINKYNNIVI